MSKRIVLFLFVIFLILLIITGFLGYLYLKETRTTPSSSTESEISPLPSIPSTLVSQSSKISTTSSLRGYELELKNGAVIEKYAEQMGIFSKDGFTLPYADLASESVPKDSLHNTVNQISINLDEYTGTEVIEIDPFTNKPYVHAGASFVDDKHTLQITMLLPTAVFNNLKQNEISIDALSTQLNTKLFSFLTQLGQKYTLEQLEETHLKFNTEMEQLATKNNLPITIKIK